jgi:hypothetical protein
MERDLSHDRRASAHAGTYTVIETRFTLRIFRTVDRWYVRLLNLAKSSGFLGSGRETVNQVSEDDRNFVEFPDLSDEGWPTFRFPVPSEATLSHTTSGMFYRGAHFLSPILPEELALRYKAALSESGINFEARDEFLDEFIRTFDLGGDVRLRIGRHRKGRTPISIGQYRDTGSVEDSIRKATERNDDMEGETDWGPSDVPPESAPGTPPAE